MKVIKNKISIHELKQAAEELFGNLIKAVVDIEKEIMAIGGELHSDEESLLIQEGSNQSDLWGVNIYPDIEGKDWLEFDSIINIRPSQNNMSRCVDNPQVKEKITKTYTDLKIATHYGCHALRPSDVTGFDDPVNPELFDKLVSVTGAESIHWQYRLDCCGAPLFGTNDDLSMDLTKKKINNARESGADFLCDACSYCHIQFDTVQGMANFSDGGNHALPAILYTQLLGLCLGIDGETLGLGENKIDITSVEKFLSE